MHCQQLQYLIADNIFCAACLTCLTAHLSAETLNTVANGVRYKLGHAFNSIMGNQTLPNLIVKSCIDHLVVLDGI